MRETTTTHEPTHSDYAAGNAAPSGAITETVMVAELTRSTRGQGIGESEVMRCSTMDVPDTECIDAWVAYRFGSDCRLLDAREETPGRMIRVWHRFIGTVWTVRFADAASHYCSTVIVCRRGETDSEGYFSNVS